DCADAEVSDAKNIDWLSLRPTFAKRLGHHLIKPRHHTDQLIARSHLNRLHVLFCEPLFQPGLHANKRTHEFIRKIKSDPGKNEQSEDQEIKQETDELAGKSLKESLLRRG